MIPKTFDEWRNCIVNDCKINLSKEFAQERLSVYKDMKHKETQKFVSLYGMEHLEKVIFWYSQI